MNEFDFLSCPKYDLTINPPGITASGMCTCLCHIGLDQHLGLCCSPVNLGDEKSDTDQQGSASPSRGVTGNITYLSMLDKPSQAGFYQTIVVDPPWSYNDKLQSGNSGFGKNKLSRGAANHYKTMSLHEIFLTPIPDWAANNAHLYLWTTNAFMYDACALMTHWGFTQKTILTWGKPQIGMGRYYRNNTEHVLFGVRGKLAALRKDVPTLFMAPRKRHSEKPDKFYKIVESMSPGSYLDVFARRTRAGWDVYGDEILNENGS